MKMNVKGNDNFQTPDNLFMQLHRIFNFQFDVACTRENCKCEYGIFHDEGMDALTRSWGGLECFVIRHLARKQILSKRLTKKLCSGIVRFVLWFCLQIVKTVKRFNNTSKRTFFMKPCPEGLPLLIRKQNSR